MRDDVIDKDQRRGKVFCTLLVPACKSEVVAMAEYGRPEIIKLTSADWVRPIEIRCNRVALSKLYSLKRETAAAKWLAQRWVILNALPDDDEHPLSQVSNVVVLFLVVLKLSFSDFYQRSAVAKWKEVTLVNNFYVMVSRHRGAIDPFFNPHYSIQRFPHATHI